MGENFKGSVLFRVKKKDFLHIDLFSHGKLCPEDFRYINNYIKICQIHLSKFIDN